ncbi:hypothetical protein EIP91_007265 [Steccherinum ochraceum]|uniref:GCN5-related N-acetyltransferase Rv2170-like domain-containing protein n=1 Tax=Steccherinum ochraceum TaxID=92696 RepID=A0A4R0R4G0_9APHY|nr:hypothetical protein EIP91_007265 [Steccherinum ochraceum]
MIKTQLYRVPLETPENVEALADILHPLLPLSLTALGCLYAGDINTPNGTGNIDAWITFPVDQLANPPSLFSIFILTGWNDWQLRFFCSTETSTLPPTREEEEHVVGAFNAFAYALQSQDPVVEGCNGKRILNSRDMAGLFVGALHDRWAECLAPGIFMTSPCIRFASRPVFNGDEPAWNTFDGEGDWEFGELRESDLDFVKDRSVFPRSMEFLKQRIPYSVCIRRKGGEGLPIAWEVLYPDGSSGMLHVEPDYRKAGLGRKCVAALSRKMAQRYRSSENKKSKERYPYVRWELSDVVIGNDAGLKLAASRKGWKHSWICHWAHLRIIE